MLPCGCEVDLSVWRVYNSTTGALTAETRATIRPCRAHAGYVRPAVFCERRRVRARVRLRRNI